MGLPKVSQSCTEVHNCDPGIQNYHNIITKNNAKPQNKVFFEI